MAPFIAKVLRVCEDSQNTSSPDINHLTNRIQYIIENIHDIKKFSWISILAGRISDEYKKRDNIQTSNEWESLASYSYNIWKNNYYNNKNDIELVL